MAEAWAKKLKAGKIEAFSAGTSPAGLDPRGVAVMAEAGVDMSGHSSKHVAGFEDVEFDYVITLCESAKESCPVFPGRAMVVHRGFDDPPLLAQNAATEEEALRHYRRVRDEIRDFVAGLPMSLPKKNLGFILDTDLDMKS